jgi:YD repeat-containing protein
MYDKNSNFLKFVYSGPVLHELQDNNGRKLTFKYTANTKRVSEITGPGGSISSYAYKGEDLTGVTNAWKNRYTYQYDTLHNLTKINYPDGTYKALTYNEEKDWVTSFTDRYKCVETYVYESSQDDPKNHYSSKVEKKCKNEVTNYARYEFWFKDKGNGSGKALARVKTESKNDNLDITYHEIFGRPLTIIRNGSTVNFSYYPNGLVQSKSSRYQTMAFEYDKVLKKVSQVKTQFKDEKGKIVRNRNTDFQYDDKGNLKYAANTDGQKVWLTYDTRGRIASIKDQAKKTVEITYEEKWGKPSLVTRPGVGTITVSYNADGQIDKVDSKQGPTVAVQVASTFNNLLDVIAPATNDISI